MKLIIHILPLIIVLAQNPYAFGQNVNSKDTTSFNKNNLVHKNMIKFSGIYLPTSSSVVLLTVGYERALNKNYSAEIVYGALGYGGDGPYWGIWSLHNGVKYYFLNANFQKSKRFF